MEMSEANILEEFSNIVSNSLRVNREAVKPESHLMKDLGAESLDLIGMTMDAESTFNVCIPARNILDTAADVFGPDVLVRDGYLTEEGKAMFLARLGDSDTISLKGEVAITDVENWLMTVQSWAKMIYHLTQQTPSQCSQCAGELKPDLGSRMKCSLCGQTVLLPAGEDINREWVQNYYDSVCINGGKDAVREKTSAALGEASAAARK